MPIITLPPRVRLAIYLVSGLGSAVLAYLVAKDIAGDAEVTLWAAVVAIVNGLSAANVPTKRGEQGAVSLVEALMVAVLAVLLIVLIERLL